MDLGLLLQPPILIPTPEVRQHHSTPIIQLTNLLPGLDNPGPGLKNPNSGPEPLGLGLENLAHGGVTGLVNGIHGRNLITQFD